jgi:hypothetical protein
MASAAGDIFDEQERWRPVVGHEGAYEVSDHGRVRSLDRRVPLRENWTRFAPGRDLHLWKHPRGYLHVNIAGRTTPVHRLVLEAFVGPAPEGTEGLHWNDDPADNRLQNLRWGSRPENEADKIRNGGHYLVNRTRCTRGHLLDAPNLVPSLLRRGHRTCLACNRARSWWRPRRSEMTDDKFQRTADAYYESLMIKAMAGEAS